MTNWLAVQSNPIDPGDLETTDIVVLNDPDNPLICKGIYAEDLATALAAMAAPALSVAPGAGFSGGTGTVVKSSVKLEGGIRTAEFIFDLTGLGSSTTLGDIIGQGLSAAYLAQILAVEVGTPLIITLECDEAPAVGVNDIDLYSATENTGVFDGAIGSLTETLLIDSAGAWTNGRKLAATAMPAANSYLYLTNGAAGTVGTYTAGKFTLTIKGYDA